MKTNKIILIIISAISISGITLSSISEGFMSLLTLGAILGAIFGAIYAGQNGRNKWLWGILCLIMPYLFPIILAFLKPQDSKAFNLKNSENKKALKNILLGSFWIIVGGIILGINIEEEDTLFIVISSVVILSGLIQLISGIALSSSSRIDKEVAKQVDEVMKNAELTKASEYPALKEVKDLIQKEDYDEAILVLMDELKSVHKRNKDIYQELTKEFQKLLGVIYSKKNIPFNFNQSNYSLLVEEFRNNIDILIPLIEKYGHENVMIDSPNFGTNLPENIVVDLKRMHNRNDEIDKEISKIFGELPKLE